jgi:hypothetical protein
MQFSLFGIPPQKTEIEVPNYVGQTEIPVFSLVEVFEAYFSCHANKRKAANL